MLDKLSRNKLVLVLLIVFAAISCGKTVYYNTEIICPDGSTILVKYARLEEMKQAIIKADLDKKKFRTSESYTVIRLPGNRSFKIEKIAPEEAIKCSLKQSPMGEVDRQYIHHYIPN